MPPILSAIVLVIAVIAFAAIVSTRSGRAIAGGLPAASFTYRLRRLNAAIADGYGTIHDEGR